MSLYSYSVSRDEKILNWLASHIKHGEKRLPLKLRSFFSSTSLGSTNWPQIYSGLFLYAYFGIHQLQVIILVSDNNQRCPVPLKEVEIICLQREQWVLKNSVNKCKWDLKLRMVKVELGEVCGNTMWKSLLSSVGSDLSTTNSSQNHTTQRDLFTWYYR